MKLLRFEILTILALLGLVAAADFARASESRFPPVQVDASTVEKTSANVLRVKDAGITPAKLSFARTAQASAAASGEVLSTASSGAWTNATVTLTAVTNLTGTVVTNGRPVLVMMVSDTTTSNSHVRSYWSPGSTNPADAYIAIKRDSGYISQQYVDVQPNAASSSVREIGYPCSAFQTIDFPGAGTHTYTIYGAVGNATTLEVTGCKLVAFEIL